MTVGGLIAARRRERELASDSRAGTFARSRARRQQQEFLRRNWVLVLVFSLFVCLVVGVACWFTSSPFVRGLAVGLALAAVPGLIWSWTVQVTGTAPTMMGDQAEQWTAQELRKGRRHGWRLVNHVLLRGRGDIDHVLVGPAGAWAVETKWSSRWPSGLAESDTVRSAAARTSASARSLRLWSPLRKLGVDVRPLVVLWGGGLGDRPEFARGTTVDGVLVVPGRALRTWVAAQEGVLLRPDVVTAACAALDDQVRAREAADRTANPMPTSFARYLARAGAAVLGVLAAILAFSAALPPGASTPRTLVLSAVLLALPTVPWRITGLRRIRPFLWGWVAASSSLVVASLGYALVVLAR